MPAPQTTDRARRAASVSARECGVGIGAGVLFSGFREPLYIAADGNVRDREHHVRV
jgi:hypothetical protein